MENTSDKPINLSEQLKLAQKLLAEAEVETAFRRGIVHTLEQLVQEKPVILIMDISK